MRIQLGLVMVVALLAGLVVAGRPSQPAAVTVAALPSPSLGLPSPAASPTVDPGNLDDDVGALVVVSWRASVPWTKVQALITADHVGGVLMFGPNFGGGVSGLRSWNDRIAALASAACFDHPILSMLDEEGGAVAQVKAAFAPPSQLMAAAGGASRVMALERANGAGLRSAGVGLDLAPVADVRTNSRDAIIGDRSFGSNPSAVAALVAAAVAGLHEGGEGATLKHFPGLGGAPGDPHVAIPTDPESQSQWQRVQVPGFAAGIAAGADAVMVTAVYTPGLGGGSLPAMFAPAVVGKLRSQLGFSGVIMTDSLSMGGVTARWSLPDAAVMALEAGNDMVLLGNGDPAYEAAAIAAIKAAVLSGRLDRARLHASAMRVNALRDRWGRRPIPCRSPLAG